MEMNTPPNETRAKALSAERGMNSSYFRSTAPNTEKKSAAVGLHSTLALRLWLQQLIVSSLGPIVQSLI